MKPDDPQKKSNGEPTAGFAHVPIWLILALGAIFFWGEGYISRDAGGYDEAVYAPFHSRKELEDASPIDPAEALRKFGEGVFLKNCAACHQPTGLGKDGVAPPLAGSEWVQAAGANRILHAVMNGLTGPITVKGQIYTLTMPPWRDVLSDKEIAAALSYVRGQKSWGNSAGAVTEQQVKAVRAESHPAPMAGEAELKTLAE